MTKLPLVDLARQHAPLQAELRAAFDRVMASSAFVLGEEVERFEADFAAYCGARHCVGVGSGTAALQIMLEAAGIGGGDEVIVPAHTFIASALAVLYTGATPVPVDVEYGTGLIDARAAQEAIGPATAAILGIHLYGQACAIGELRDLCDHHGLLLLEDAAQAHGATYRGARAGSLGDAAAFSFYPSKNLGALGDAGAICTSDADLAAAARRLRNLGRDRDREHLIAGYNERLDGLQAALLRVKLKYVDGWNAERRRLAARYRSLVSDAVGDEAAEPLAEHPASPCIYHLFPIRVGDRDGLARALGAAGIATGVHYPRAVVDQPALQQLLQPSGRPIGESLVPVARDWAGRELSLPIFPGMRNEELEAVVTAIRAALGEPRGLVPTGRLRRDGEDLVVGAE